jgi:ABC-2 type transport system permease protein
MSGLRMNIAAGFELVRRDTAVFLSYRLSFVTPLFGALFSVTLFHFISRLVHARVVGSPDTYFAYVVVGLVILGVLTSALAMPASMVRQELVAGTFERLVLSAFGGVRSIVAMMGFPLLRAVVVGVVTLVFADVAFGLSLRWPEAPLAIPVGVLAALAFAPFGLAAAAAAVLFKRAEAVTMLVMAGVSLVAGVYFPISLLPDWIRWAAHVQPFTPAIELMRHLLVGTPLTGSAGGDLLKLLAFAAILLPLAGGLVGVALRIGRRRGTLIEY